MKKRFVLVSTLATLWACSSGETVSKDAAPDLQEAADSVAETTSPEVTSPDLRTDETAENDEWTLEITPDTGPGECQPGDGCFLDPCSGGEDCLSGWCVDHMGESVCTINCQDECPAGWSCQLVAGSAPDVVFICMSDFTHLCRPCATALDCKSAIGQEDVCVDYGEEGSFCGGGCLSNEECPWGFSCGEALSVDGISTKQCVADAGVCPCTGKAVELALWTPCEVGNEFGSCTGKRVCTESGLTDCDASVPAAEVCNGIDDDCDGEVDENTCDDGNPCTADSCLGEDGCVNEPLDAGECMDGNPCTVADHCEAGECVGQLVDCDDDNPCTDDWCNPAGGCAHGNSTEKCDDGDPCTVADQCADGECSGYAVNCDCQADADCKALEDGNLCNGTLVCSTEKLPYQCVVDPETVVTCPEPTGEDAFCQQAACDPATGTCSVVPDHEGFACDDLDGCTMGEKCSEGSCGGGSAVNCNDGNPCTDDSCEAGAGCLSVDNDVACTDGNACTVGDTCAGGECQAGAPVDCDDGNPCTVDSCNPAEGCAHAPTEGACDDGNACTVGDACANGQCKAGTELLDCADENPCTDDSCDAAAGCVHTLNTNACDDGSLCTTGDHCQLGECIGGQEVSCDDGNGCTDDACDAEDGCVHTPSADACDDGNACTVGDTCANGQCMAGKAMLDCDDEDVCTDDSCDADAGCVHTLNTAPCDDGEFCTTNDHCQLGECVGGQAMTCDDSNPCTEDACVDGIGCQFLPTAGACDDGNDCTVGDTCKQGWCLGSPADCDDDNPCTSDSCAPDQGCINTPNALSCDDGNLCTLKDQCANGECVGGLPLNCDDSNPCTQDSCDTQSGCLHEVAAGACDDNNACTDGDTCKNGLCIPGPVTNCDDDNECTTDSCDEQNGCGHVNVADGTACNGGGKWACLAGECACTPQCAGKECGDDQCGGSCGECGENEACNENTGQCYPGGGVIFGPYTWYLGPRGGSCLGVCEAHGLSCANLVASGWTETCGNNVCNQFFPGLGCQSDGDGPRLSAADADGLPSGNSKCIYHNWNWSGWSCAWQQRPDDVRICPCQ
jgi:hypothetical protein